MNAAGLSVIIITFNRAGGVLQCLECLEKQTVSNFEVVVINDGSTDNTAEVLANYTSEKFVLTVITKGNEGRSVSRNLGAAKAKGEMLIFFDDDMRPLPTCLSAHLDVVGPNRINVGTQEEDPSLIRNDFDRFRYHIGKRWEHTLSTDSRAPYLTAANFSVYKSLFRQLGGFDPRAEVVEDLDLALRATKVGVQFKYNPEARAWHDNRVNCTTFIRKEIEYYRSHINLASLRPERKQTFALYQPGAAKRAIYSLVCRPFVIGLVDRDFFRYVMPSRLRYKFYDVLITGFAKVYPSRYKLQAIQYHG